MVTPNVWRSVVVFVALFGFVLCKSPLIHRHKRNEGSNLGQLEAALEAQIKSFGPESFGMDIQLLQHVDRTNKISHYRFLTEEEHVYERNSDDGGKTVVILSQEEDKLPFKKTKRAFVVLKKAPEGTNYYAELALVRDATSQDKTSVSVNGANKVIEWTYYDDHVIHGRSPMTLVTLTCVSSVLVPCMFNESALTPPEKFPTAPRFEPKHPSQNLIDEVQAIKLKTEDGSDPDENYDLYIDLEVNKVQGRSVVGQILTGGLVPGILSGASGLICGVLSIVGICGKKVGTDTVIVNESGMDLTPDQIQAAMLNQQLGRRKRGAPDLDKVLDYPGWKTQYKHPSKGMTLEHESEIFFGFGNCPYVQVKHEELANSKSVDDILHHYATILRSECIVSTKPMIENLIADKLLVINDVAFDLSSSHKSLNEPKLSLKELLSLSTATEFAAFSQVYAAEVKSKPSGQKSLAPDGTTHISRSVHFIVKVALNYLKLTREKTRSHILHLTRNLVQNLHSVCHKLAQDYQNLEKCSDCQEDKESNLRDREIIVALTQFIKRGLGPVEKGADIAKTFDNFFVTNHAAFKKAVATFM